MELKDNPLLQPEDYRAGYQESIDNLKNRPELVQFDKLCYELFEGNEMGKKFIELAKEKYLIPSLVERGNANYQLMLMWADGFKDAFRMLIQSSMSHAQRIKAEESK